MQLRISYLTFSLLLILLQPNQAGATVQGDISADNASPVSDQGLTLDTDDSLALDCFAPVCINSVNHSPPQRATTQSFPVPQYSPAQPRAPPQD